MATHAEKLVTGLRSNWAFKEKDSTDEWLEVAQFPTNIHLDLIKHKKIPDPFFEKNELKVGWVAEKHWTYKTVFPSPANLSENKTYILAFDGLDTYSTVLLNGKEILKSDNMFISHRIDVSAHLSKDGSQNELLLHFEPALERAKEIRDAYPDHVWKCWNGDTARLAVRKAQYHFGWDELILIGTLEHKDWGGVYITCGPWRDIRLEEYSARLSDLVATVSLTDDNKEATVTVKAHVDSPTNANVAARNAAKVVLSIAGSHGVSDSTVSLESTAGIEADGSSVATFKIDDPALWWPHGYGKQNLYTVTAKLIGPDNTIVDTISKKTGIRKAEVIQEEDKHGKSFYFRINGVDIYCGGSDWIPADNFTPRVTEEKYRDWLELMVHGNQAMIRVWGGGIFEEDIFYDLCDELGILVWQDFLFGCGNYPAFPEILESVKIESRQNVIRLRHHPSIVIYAGNNEDYQLQESFGLTYDYEDKNPENWLKTNFPARYIYEKILPDIMEEDGNGVFYHPGSPWGDGKITSDRTVGDMHQWNVWHGTQEKYQIFEHLGGRFNSEFGMEGFPHIQTIDSFLSPGSGERYQQSSTVDFHNKADGHERRIATYLVENFRTVEDFEGFIHLSQLVQSEALAYGYRGWRRQWGDSRRCGGALVWQLNDCWPGTSWAIVDYYLRKKPAYYTIARALQPLGTGIQREHWDWSVTHARPLAKTKWESWITSSKLEAVRGKLVVRFISISTGKDVAEPLVKEDIEIVPNGTTDRVFTGEVDNVTTEPHVLSVVLSVDGKIVARDVDWPQPLKYHSFADRGLKIRFDLPGKADGKKRDAQGKIVIMVEKPLKGLVWEERTGVRVSDSAIDVVPGEEIIVDIFGLLKGEEELSWRYLGM
ncbi:Beta-mannosidase [Dactylellina cionopaga]|nr:Beta-mannosidase [Dactylellina cionopaga]